MAPRPLTGVFITPDGEVYAAKTLTVRSKSGAFVGRAEGLEVPEPVDFTTGPNGEVDGLALLPGTYLVEAQTRRGRRTVQWPIPAGESALDIGILAGGEEVPTNPVALAEEAAQRILGDAATAAGAPRNFVSRAVLAAWVAAGNVPAPGQMFVAVAEGLAYRGATGATAVPGLPGLLPLAPVTPQHFGAVADGVVNCTAAIQAATDHLTGTGGGRLLFPAGTYAIRQAGTRGGRGYCLIHKSNVLWDGEAPGQVVLSYAGTAATLDVIISSANGTFPAGLVDENIGMRNIVVDGDGDVGATGDGFNIWFQRVKGLTLENVLSVNATNWGARIEQCDGVTIQNFGADHVADVNADGIHFVDCRNVTGDQFNIYSEGDDGLIIETLSHDVFNISVTNVNVRCPTAGIAAGRGVLILHEDLASPATRLMENIHVQAVCRDCFGAALELSGAMTLRASSFDIAAENCRSVIYTDIGTAAAAGFVQGCTFDLLGVNLTQIGGLIQDAPGAPSAAFGAGIADNHIRATIRNPGDGAFGFRLTGQRWSGAILIDYDPEGSKTVFQPALDTYASDSVLTVSAIGAPVGLQVRDEARRSTFHVGDVNGLSIIGAAAPTLIGGRISGTITGTARLISAGGAFQLNAQITGTAVTQSGTDTTAGRILKVGDYGLGAVASVPVLADLNAVDTPGGVRWRYDGATAGTLPSGAASAGWVDILRTDTGTFLQVLTENAAVPRRWRRRYTAGAFGGWERDLGAADLAASATDGTEGRVAQMRADGGWFGLGAANRPVLADLDATGTRDGRYRATAAGTTGTRPSGAATNGWVDVARFDGGTLTQTYRESATACREWRRQHTSGSWAAWQGPF